jgi:2-polyprenyl-6-methoxyphenol hydroxylase-like FAD-dependent oxidoreductase
VLRIRQKKNSAPAKHRENLRNFRFSLPEKGIAKIAEIEILVSNMCNESTALSFEKFASKIIADTPIAHNVVVSLDKHTNLLKISRRSDLGDGSEWSVVHETEDLSKLIALYITEAAINRSLYFKDPRELALISGAGIAGLTASFELLEKGFKVVIAEKRGAFDRFNVINLDVETQRFLKKFGLLKEFEESVAARIKTHNCVLYREDGFKTLGSSDVSQLQPSDTSFEPEFLNQLFNQDGIYSARIKDLQTFLAKKALEAGVHMFFDVEVNVLDYTEAIGVSKVQIKGKDSLFDPIMLKPSLFFLAEGAHSTTATQLGMNTNGVTNECTGENWIFGNLQYSGKETFVVSMIDTSEGSLEIANIIFNAKIGEISIAVTSKDNLSQKLIQERILMIAERVFSFQHVDEIPLLITSVKHPVQVNNEQRVIYSRDNVFCIGDAAGHSSPLAGMGGTLGLTCVPYVIEQLVKDREQQPLMMHPAFNRYSEAYTSRWIEKSQRVKNFCLDKALPVTRSKPQ